MNTMMTSTRLSLASAVCALVLFASSCQTVTPVDNSPGTLALTVTPTVGSQAFDTTKTFSINNRNVRFTLGQIYVSNITLVKSDGSTVKLTTTPISLRSASATGDTTNAAAISVTEQVLFYQHHRGTNAKTADNVPSGQYTGIRFTVGIENPTNLIDASEVARLSPQHPLALITNAAERNWWSWNSGYIFAKMEGVVDTSAAGTGTPNVRWFYHIGSTGFTAPISISKNFEIKGGQSSTLSLTFDYAKVLSGIDWRNAQDRSTMCIRPAAAFPNDRPLGTKIMTNVATAITAQ